MSSTKEFKIRGKSLERYLGNGGDVIVPERVTRIAAGAFRGCATVTSVSVPDTVTKIGEHAFEGCHALRSVVLPKGLKAISGYMFYHCINLTDILIPDGVTMIGERAFADCYSLTSLAIPDSVIQIGNGAFSDCEKLCTVNLKQGLRDIGYMAFSKCSRLEIIDLPQGLVYIGGSAFEQCSALKSIIIPETVMLIQSSAFRRCSMLDRITISGCATEISGSVFDGCSSLMRIEFGFDDVSRIEHYRDAFFKHGIVFFASVLRYFPDYVLKNSHVYTMIKLKTKSVIEIARRYDDVEMLVNLFAIIGQVELDELNKYIESSRDSVAIMAFLLEYRNNVYSVEQQEEHERIKIEKSLGLIPMTEADYKKIFKIFPCGNGVEINRYISDEPVVYIPEKIGDKTVLSIADSAFSDCPHITAVFLSDKLDKICRYAFIDCTNLERVVIPSAITEMERLSFVNCPNVTIQAPAGSIAEKCAWVYNINFEALG